MKTANLFMKKGIIIPFVLVVVMLLCMASCNVTRVVTNESSYFQRGDTTVTIITKTIESYDGSKK